MTKKKKSKKTTKKKPTIKKTLKTLKKSKLLSFLVLFLSFFILFIAINSFGIYLLSWNNSYVQGVSRVIPFPVVFIGKQASISFYDYSYNVEIIRRYHNMQGVIWSFDNYDLGNEEGVKYLEVAKKNTLNRMIENKVIDILIQEYNIEVTQSDIENEKGEILKSNGGENKSIQKLTQVYEINLREFEELVLVPQLKREKLRNFLKNKGEIESDADFDEWLNSKMKRFNISIALKKYFWSKKDAKVYFSDQEMNKYEKEILK